MPKIFKTAKTVYEVALWTSVTGMSAQGFYAFGKELKAFVTKTDPQFK